MVSAFNATTESLFLSELNSLNETNSGNEDYKKLFYFIYQIRYENFRNKNFIRYLTSLRLHFFLKNIDFEEIKKFDPFLISMFQLITEFDQYMEYKFLSNNGFQIKKNKIKCQSSLGKMESMPISENKSFDIIKTYLLGKIYLDIEINYYKAFKKFQQLSIMFPQNIIFKETAAECKKYLAPKPVD